ncbi:DNA-dependent DNA polymerase X related protein [Thermoplasma acidophilum]|uniref:DNA polymerase beta n=2 Tax=Thermoplasma acidophilum TaxID=2303 RepID=Q9HK48_THEAC|nr:DNA-dependent DNA polymerase X related protein [Thermoplasma acidophilum]
MFEEIAYMILADGNEKSRFEANAYLRAARSLRSITEDVEDIYNRGGIEALTSVEGIGKKIASYIEEYIKTGRIKRYDDLKIRYPVDFRDLSRVQGLGPRKIVSLYKYAGVKNIDDLKAALADHRIASIPGFGEKSEKEIAENIQIAEMSFRRIPLPQGYRTAMEIADEIERAAGTVRVSVAGSIRRMRDTVGDIDLLCVTSDPPRAIAAFTGSKHCQRVVSSGEKKVTIATDAGVTCDLRIIDKGSFGSALQYFTGSKDHNIKLRKIAIDRGLKLNEYGLFRGNSNLVENQGEEKIYAELGMQYIPPELREDRGEIDRAISMTLPELVEAGDIRGDLYISYEFIRKYGADVLKKMERLQYFGVVLGSPEEKEGIKSVMNDGRIFLGIELTSKTYAEDAGEFDFTVLDLSGFPDEASARGAIESVKPTFIRNVTGRTFSSGRKMDPANIFEAAAKSGSAVMITASNDAFDPVAEDIMPHREGLMFALASFAQRPDDLGDMTFGIGIARRAWISKDRIINTMDYEKIAKIMRRP